MQEYDRLKKDWEILRYLFLFLYYIYAQYFSWFQDSFTFHLLKAEMKDVRLLLF